MYKLIALDMDGTAFNENHEISDEVKDSLFYAMSKGIKIAFISKREEFHRRRSHRLQRYECLQPETL